MTTKLLNLTPALHQYMLDVSLRETPVQKKLRELTAKMPQANMQISADQAQFMALMAQLIGAKNIIEVGVFTGYSALSVALAMPDDGKIIACDVSEEWTAIARDFWHQAAVAHKIDLRLAPAQETLQALIDAGKSGSFDMAFIDADKSSYATYYEQCLQLMRSGGLIMIDNVLWSGDVINSDDQSIDTIAIREFNQKLQNDLRISLSLLPLADGLSLAVKK